MFKQIVVTLDRYEGDFAVLRHKDHEMLWPREDLPGDSAEGSVITLTAMNEKQVEKDRSSKAKLLINDILNSTIGTAPGTAALSEADTMKEIELEERKELRSIDERLKDLNKKMSDRDR